MPILSKSLEELCRDGQLLATGLGSEIFAVQCDEIRAPMVVKKLSVPVSQTMVSGLIYSRAVADEQAALEYYRGQTEDLKRELRLTEPLREHPHYLPYLDTQVVEKADGVGFDVKQLRDMDVTHEGLANVRERIRLEVGGELTITSSPGRKTTAIVTIRPPANQNGNK